MGHDKGGSAFHNLCKGRLDFHFRSGIDGGCGLIQNQHRGMSQHQSRNTQKLFLSLRKVVPFSLQHRIISLWHFLYKIMGIGSFCRRYDFVLTCLGICHFQIIENRIFFQPGFLKHHSKVGAKVGTGHVFNIYSIHQNFSGIRFIESHQQIDKGGFSCTGRTYDGHPLSR